MSKGNLDGWGKPPRKRTDIPPSSSPSPDDADPMYGIAPQYSATYQANTGKLVLYGSIAAIAGLGVLGIGRGIYKMIRK